MSAPATTVGGSRTGGDGSAIGLTALGRAEIDGAELGGELGCSFNDGAGAPLLVAMGDVASQEPSLGIVKVGDHVERVAAPGGFDAMIEGATFSGRDTTVTVELTSSKPVGGGESPPFPARLTHVEPDGASRTFDGTWTCGP